MHLIRLKTISLPSNTFEKVGEDWKMLDAVNKLVISIKSFLVIANQGLPFIIYKSFCVLALIFFIMYYVVIILL